jgi:hypothetical protein
VGERPELLLRDPAIELDRVVRSVERERGERDQKSCEM